MADVKLDLTKNREGEVFDFTLHIDINGCRSISGHGYRGTDDRFAALFTGEVLGRDFKTSKEAIMALLQKAQEELSEAYNKLREEEMKFIYEGNE